MAKAATGEPKANAKKKPKPKLTAKERHKRFVDMAHEVEADESPEAFDRAFERIARITPPSYSDIPSGKHKKSHPS
jgi:hypothetical protein